jgi:hypothetical protein
MRAEPRHKPIPLEAATLLSEGRVIDAIKVVRTQQGSGLKEAKDAVDAHIAADPALGVFLETRQRAARKKFFFWFFVVDALVFGVLYYHFIYLQK